MLFGGVFGDLKFSGRAVCLLLGSSLGFSSEGYFCEQAEQPLSLSLSLSLRPEGRRCNIGLKQMLVVPFLRVSRTKKKKKKKKKKKTIGAQKSDPDERYPGKSFERMALVQP